MIAPVPHNEAARLEALLACAILDTPPEAVFDGMAAEIAQVLEAPIALIGFIDQDRHWFKAKYGTEVCENKREWAVCAHTIYQGGTLVCENIALEPRFLDMPPLSALGIRAYAGTPIFVRGLAIGTVCVFDYAVRSFCAAQLETLEGFAVRVGALLEARNSNRKLLERIRSTQRPPSRVRLDWLATNRARVVHQLELPQGKHWQLWAMRPNNTNPYKLERFVGSDYEFCVPKQADLVLLSLESNHATVEHPTDIRAVFRLELRSQGQVLC
ncbi:MAG: GAF domain-containing protein [Deinococcales bacterium]